MLERAAASALGGPAFWAMTVPCKKFNDTTQPDRFFQEHIGFTNGIKRYYTVINNLCQVIC